MISTHSKHLIANGSFSFERFDSAAQKPESIKKEAVILSVSYDILFQVWHYEAHRPAVLKNPSTLGQKVFGFAILQMLKKVLAMNMASATIQKWKPVAHIQIERFAGDRLKIDVYPPLRR
jgi:hypothetical protein